MTFERFDHEDEWDELIELIENRREGPHWTVVVSAMAALISAVGSAVAAIVLAFKGGN